MRALRPLTGAALALVLAACQPEARRLLLLDEAFTQPAELDATARPWRDAGYRVDYRRYYPHLTREDLERYRVLMVLGGSGLTSPADALDVGDLAILTEWTQRGGVVVLGYPPEGGGAFDRWLMNRWLAWSGAGITIGDVAVSSAGSPRTAARLKPVLTAGLRGTGFDAFPAGTSNALLVENEAQSLARAADGAAVKGAGLQTARRGGITVVAASRAGGGLVVVASRSTLAALGEGDPQEGNLEGPAASADTREFLVALARFTRRPAEWARIPTAGARVPLRLTGGSQPVPARSPPAHPPSGVTAERLLPRPALPPPPTTGLPAWVLRQGVRALEGDFPALAPARGPAARAAALDTLTTMLDVGAFNLLLTNAHVAPLVDSVAGGRWERDALRSAWQQVASRLQATSVRWVPLVLPRDLRAPTDSSPAPACPLDPALWGRLVSAVRVLARLASEHHDLIPAVGITLDETTPGWGSPPLCDDAWTAGLAALLSDSALTRERAVWLQRVPLAARYDSLLEGGLLAAYDTAVTTVVLQRATALRTDLRRARRDLLFAVVLDRSPTDWFTLGLVRGLSTPELPTLVFSPEPRARALLGTGGAVNVLHVLRLDPSVLLEAPPPQLARTVFGAQGGFWLGPAEALLSARGDSLARRVRRFTKDR
jgi:hypothetical protein